MKRTPHYFSLSLAIVLAILYLVAVFAPLSSGDPTDDQAAAPKDPSARIHIEIDTLGNARIKADVANVSKRVDPTESPASIAADLLSYLGLDQTCYDCNDLNADTNPDIDGFDVDYKVTGLAHPADAQSQWDVPLSIDMPKPNVQVTGNTIAITSGIAGFPYQGLDITLPAGSTNIALSDDHHFVTYTAPQTKLPAKAGADCSVKFNVESLPQIMSVMSKSYGSDRLPTLWVARSTFTNSGAAALKGYWVRFRVDDYTADFSPWVHYAGLILPGQTIVSPYHPKFDLDKMKNIEGTRQTTLEAEYAYENPQGKTILKTVSRDVDILGRNDVVLPQDQWEYVLPSFVTKDDPMIRQIASMVAAQMPEGMNTGTNAGAKEFMNQLYRFMKANHIVYQCPALDINLDHAIQHVKFGRDVIIDKAGTCIDLAIFYASVCEAGGLEPVLYLPEKDQQGHDEGHCFVGVHMPGKDEAGNAIDAPIVAVETTMIGHPEAVFEDAVAAGADEQQTMLDNHAWPTVDIADMRERGVHSMELPDLPAETLRDLGIAAAPAPRSIAGCWDATFNDKNGKPVNVELQVQGDGSAKFAIEPGDGERVDFQTGAADYDGQSIRFANGKFTARAMITWKDNDRITCDWMTSDNALIKGQTLEAHRVPGRDLSLLACIANIPAPKLLPPAVLPQIALSQVNAVSLSDLDPLNPNTGKIIHYDLEIRGAVNTPCVATLTFVDILGNPITTWAGQPISRSWNLTPPYADTRYAKMSCSLNFGDIDWLKYPSGVQIFYKLQVRRVSDGAVIGGDTLFHSFTAN